MIKAGLIKVKSMENEEMIITMTKIIMTKVIMKIVMIKTMILGIKIGYHIKI